MFEPLVIISDMLIFRVHCYNFDWFSTFQMNGKIQKHIWNAGGDCVCIWTCNWVLNGSHAFLKFKHCIRKARLLIVDKLINEWVNWLKWTWRFKTKYHLNIFQANTSWCVSSISHNVWGRKIMSWIARELTLVWWHQEENKGW